MNQPRVSICLPNLNNQNYLEERLETIYAQSFGKWELIVSDNYSEDGAWELFQTQARNDPRVRIAQAPREGMYPNWNNCIRQAKGEFIYIATSDDTMSPDCLEKLVAALDSHPECELAHCALKAIDEHGRISDMQEWWSRRSPFALSSGELLHCPHIRRAPFDGLLHLLGTSVYTSMTQLLIRRSLFDRIGFFPSRWGSVGDFNWSMRAGLVANTVHVPDTWGGWRLHASQATAHAGLFSDEHRRRIEEMIEDALTNCAKFLAPNAEPALDKGRDLRLFLREIARYTHPLQRRFFLLRSLLTGSLPAREHLRSKMPGQRPWSERGPALVQHWLETTGIGPVLTPL
jgi:GT2 family glycosyltransferase